MIGRNTIHIAFGFDHKYVMPCGVAIVSICEHTGSYIMFHALVSSDVACEDRKRLEGIVHSYKNAITYYDVDKCQFSHLPEVCHITRSTYNRFLIPKMLSADIKKVLYLDTDLIAVQSLEPLWNIELKPDEPVAMAIDARCSGVRQHNAINLPLSESYYNAGVMLMNLECWRKENISDKCIDSIMNYNWPWLDQDALNVVLRGRIKKLHLKYNLQMAFVRCLEKDWEIERDLYFTEVYVAKDDPVIIHYSEETKPWHDNYTHPEEWLKYKALSPWKDMPLEIKPKPAIFARELLTLLERNGIANNRILLRLLHLQLRILLKLLKIQYL